MNGNSSQSFNAVQSQISVVPESYNDTPGEGYQQLPILLKILYVINKMV